MTTTKKRADLETKLRRQYMRLKTINDHENRKLDKAIGELDKDVIYTLEHHISDNQQLSDLWTRCSTTTGWYDEAVKPGRRDMTSSMMTELKMTTKPWAYSTQDTIEMWAKRPSTTHIYRSKVKARPKIAVTYSGKLSKYHNGTDNVNRTKAYPVSGHPSQLNSPSRGTSASMMGDRALQQRAKSARINITSNAFHSPRLDDRHVKCNVIQRPITAGASLGRRVENATNSRRLASKSAMPSRRQDSQSSMIDDVFDEESKISKLHLESNRAGKGRPTSVTFKRSSSTFSDAKISTTKYSQRSRKTSTRVDTDTSSDDEEVIQTNTTKDTSLPKWKIPKFYVRPEERYKSEDMFLMRRYTLLQRQLAAEMPPEVVTANQKLNVNIAFSSMARKKRLKLLTEENSTKLQSEKKPHISSDLTHRIQSFLAKVDDFIEKQQTD